MPIFCTDDQVREFCESALRDFNPYGPELPLSGWELFQAPRDRFGDYRCIDLLLWLH